MKKIISKPITYSFFILFFVFVPKAMANDKSSGCGPGWYIFKEMTIVSSVGRALVNAFLAPLSTLGMTFGTSNCAPHKLVEEYKKSFLFASSSFDVLRHDVVKGYGPHLTSYLETFGCHSLIQKEIVGSLRSVLGSDTEQLKSPEALLRASVQVIRGEPYYAMQCV